MDKNFMDVYTDYLISSFSTVSATRLSQLLDNNISHDKITRFLSNETFTSKDFWKLVKPFIRKHKEEDAVIVIDDTILEKPYTDENEIISWHFDHTKGRNVKGANIVTGIYCTNIVKLPFSFEIIKKDEKYIDEESGKEKRRSNKTKNEIFREIVLIGNKNIKIFKYVLSDSWYSTSENMELIEKLKKYFIFSVKSNRLIALSEEDKKSGRFKQISEIGLEPNTVYHCYLRGVNFPLLAGKQVFKNKDGSEGVLYLVSNDLSLNFEEMTTIYKRRWKVEEYHESVKQNTGLGKSPTRTVVTQSNHFFASIYAFVKLEILSFKSRGNHYKLKHMLYLKALRESFNELKALKNELKYKCCVT